jgi:hypothetical protein
MAVSLSAPKLGLCRKLRLAPRLLPPGFWLLAPSSNSFSDLLFAIRFLLFFPAREITEASIWRCHSGPSSRGV